MNDFTVLMQIERQMQEQFHATEEKQQVALKRERFYDSLRLRLSTGLYRLASAIEPTRPASDPTPRQQLAR